MISLTTPISEEDLAGLKVGDKLSISGTIYTGRDVALPKLVKLIKSDNVPFDLNGSVIMHTAFSDAGIAPTTSSKEEIESTIPILSENGVKIHIGKGMLNETTQKELKKNNSIFVITPPVAALLTSKVQEKKCVLFENEGMEAMYELKVNDIPGIVAIHNGETIQTKKWKAKSSSKKYQLSSFITSSSYRLKIVNALRGEIKIPKELSQDTGISLSHISNFLADLKEKEIIECLNENNRKGRLYTLTALGKEVVEFMDENKK